MELMDVGAANVLHVEGSLSFQKELHMFLCRGILYECVILVVGSLR